MTTTMRKDMKNCSEEMEREEIEEAEEEEDDEDEQAEEVADGNNYLNKFFL